MKKIFLILTAAIFSLAYGARADFGVGDLAVLQIGDGTQAQANTGNSVFIDDFTTAGTLVTTYAVTDTGALALIMSGSASSEGNLSLSPDGSTLAFAGYNVAFGGTNPLAGADSVTVPRAFGSMNAAGTFILQGITTTQFSANNIRGATTDGQDNYWLSGGNSGTYYANTDNTAVANTIQTDQANTRVLSIQNGNLYFSVGSGKGILGIYAFSGAPTNAATPALVVNTGSSSSPDNFKFNAAGTTVYIADDSNFSKGGGVQRWDFASSVWTLSYTLRPEAAGNSGARSIAVDFSGANPVIYGETTEGTANQLFKITDTGASSASILLATAPANISYRGLDFAPKMIPSNTIPSLAIAQATGGQVTLLWPTSATGYSLQQNATLGTTNWTSVNTNTYPIVANGGTNAITIPIGGNQYFRLIK